MQFGLKSTLGPRCEVEFLGPIHVVQTVAWLHVVRIDIWNSGSSDEMFGRKPQGRTPEPAHTTADCLLQELALGVKKHPVVLGWTQLTRSCTLRQDSTFSF
jgi:hypothetical protein